MKTTLAAFNHTAPILTQITNTLWEDFTGMCWTIPNQVVRNWCTFGGKHVCTFSSRFLSKVEKVTKENFNNFIKSTWISIKTWN